jgi:hypothetical protein
VTFLWRLLLVGAISTHVITATFAQTPSASPDLKGAASPSPWPNNTLAPFKERLANATSVKVMTDLLGVKLGDTLKQAHARLDRLSDPAHPRKEERDAGEGEWKILWQLKGTDYSSIFIKTDEEKRVNFVMATLRSGKEVPFEKIGEIMKAPVQDANTIAWDVIRPHRSLFRVVARGENRKASTITIFTVERPEAGGEKRKSEREKD